MKNPEHAASLAAKLIALHCQPCISLSLFGGQVLDLKISLAGLACNLTSRPGMFKIWGWLKLDLHTGTSSQLYAAASALQASRGKPVKL